MSLPEGRYDPDWKAHSMRFWQARIARYRRELAAWDSGANQTRKREEIKADGMRSWEKLWGRRKQ
jgi:hypothetical protein